MLVPDPVVKMILHDDVVNRLTITAILEKLNGNLDAYPPPLSPDPKRRTGMWGRSSVWEILHNPKYSGFMVWNRRQRKRGGRLNPPEKWVWSEEPTHEALVSQEILDSANLKGIKRDNVTRRRAATRTTASTHGVSLGEDCRLTLPAGATPHSPSYL